MKLLQAAVEKIQSLEIQGATNVALFAVKSLVEYIKRNSHLPRKQLWEKISKAKSILDSARATEPTMRNGIMYIIGKMLNDEKNGILDTDLGQMSEIYGVEYENLLKESKIKIAKFGARLIPKDAENFVVQTHCHSVVVEGILIEAHRQGKNFKVISTETRPFYQGRITATKLRDAGIEVIQTVDSAMRWVSHHFHTNLMLIGADAITSEGTVLNKIGSRLLALVAHSDHIPIYSATPLLKYNPGTAFGFLEEIEMRDIKEIYKDWSNMPEGITFLNPAFETVARTYLNGLITEAGIFPSGEVHTIFRETYRFLHDAYHIYDSTQLI